MISSKGVSVVVLVCLVRMNKCIFYIQSVLRSIWLKIIETNRNFQSNQDQYCSYDDAKDRLIIPAATLERKSLECWSTKISCPALSSLTILNVFNVHLKEIRFPTLPKQLNLMYHIRS